MNPVPLGNQYDKYGTRNPVARLLMNRFLSALSALYRRVGPTDSVLEVGCGEGRLAHYLIGQPPRPRRFEACDLSLSRLAPGLDPQIAFRQASAYNLPYHNGEFELVVCCEVLEHLDEPERALSELRRVARRAVIVSTPREPLFRTLNVLRLAYLNAWGNTPGHVQHLGRKELVTLVGRHLHVDQVRTPVPWTMVLGQVSPLVP